MPEGIWVDTGQFERDGGGIPFVLLHPGIADSRIWDPVLPFLGALPVIRFDRRGFGRSARATAPYSSLGDLVAVLDELGIEKAHLVGNSMGGEASLALAVTAPERVASMALLCPGINGYDWPETDENPELEADWIRAKEAGDLAGLADVQRRIWYACGSDDYLDEQLLASVTLDRSPAAELEVENPEQWSHLGSLTIPTTVIAAELDPADSLRASLDLAERIPDAVLVELPVDHVPQYREPEMVAEAVLATAARAEDGA